MRQEIQEYQEIKEYLLGMADSDESREIVENRLMAEPEYYENMRSIEDDLTQQYVDGKLSPKEKHAFETHILISKEARETVRFARAFRRYVDDQMVPERLPAKEGTGFARFFSLPTWRMPVLAGAFGSVVLVLLSFAALWSWYANSSGSGQNVALLNRAYEKERPLESRITGLNYAPFGRTRGESAHQVDKLAFERAARQILKNADEDPTAANIILLGRLYMIEKNFDSAIQQFERALPMTPGDAQVYNDLGVAYLEKKQVTEDKEAALKLVDQALKSFDQALRLKPDLPDALFNRARCLEEAQPALNNQAKEAWQEYLKYDPTGGWADEARKHLEDLNAQPPKEISSDDLQEDFLNAARDKNDDEAFRLASQNRELIRQQYLPQKLAMSLVAAGGRQRDEIHRGLKYLGQLEKAHNQDEFASDLASFYAALSPEKLEKLKNAQSLVREGYSDCGHNQYTEAGEKFTAARDLFLQAGDTIEANTIGNYFIGYAVYSATHLKEGLELFKQVDDFSRQKKYAWFALMNSEWVIGGQRRLGYLLPAEVDHRFQLALGKAEEINDVFTTQKFVRDLLERDLQVNKQDENTFAALQKVFEYSRGTNISVRQKGRDSETVIETLAFGRMTALSQAIVKENIASGENRNDRLFVLSTQKSAGKIYTKTGDYPEAERWLMEARNGADGLGEKNRQEELTEILLALGKLESKRNKLPEAIEYFDESLRIQQQMNPPPLIYETKKSRLLAYNALQDDAAIENDLPNIITLAEEKRRNITDEQERNTFFNYEQEPYDVAIEHELRGNDIEQAFNYAEKSNSRSLLDWLQKDTKIPADKSGSVVATKPAQPLSADQIRERIPANVQLLQYAVLENKVVIWIISREKFELVTSEVKREDLTDKVKRYVSLITSHDLARQDEMSDLSRELYRILIDPALSHLDKDRKICIIPNKVLFNLPFNSLLSPDDKYLLEEFPLFYSPSANVFLLSTKRAKDRFAAGKDENLLSVGDPAFDRQQLPDLLDLPESAKEARNIAVNYSNPTVLIGEEATRAAFRKSMESADVIHFAGHYLVNPDAPLLSALVMAKSSNEEGDNFFTNADLSKEKLPRTKLVILSACQSGVEGYYNGEGLVGLSRTFLALGVPLVVASQWSVDSEATADIMKKFHRYRRQDKVSTVEALRKAQLEMINAPNERFRSPYYWASFAAFGGYAEF
jgi:CHAT domain-containing protein/cytochrome c-type biogenesis protein CcmH/NrfG